MTNFHKQKLMANVWTLLDLLVTIVAGKLHHSACFTESGLSLLEIVTPKLKLFQMEQTSSHISSVHSLTFTREEVLVCL